MSAAARNGQGFVAGSLIGTLGSLIGLGGAEFRLPVLVGVFRFGTLEAVILNKVMSLVVVAALLGVVGGELLIPVIVLLYGVDIKLAAIGGLLLGLVPAGWLMGLLGVVLMVSAIKTFQHAH